MKFGKTINLMHLKNCINYVKKKSKIKHIGAVTSDYFSIDYSYD